MRSSETDYLVVGAGAMGMAFTDALIDHADVHVTLVDRRHAASGHWQDAYPFVQLHQASVFYGVASTVLGSGAVQQRGPEAGLQERARQSEIQAYYDDILYRRFVGSGRVTFLGGERVSHRRRLPPRDVPGVGRDRARSTCDAASSTPPTCRRPSPRRHRRRSALPTTSASSPINELARLDAAPQQLRDRRFRQDRHRRDRVVAGERRAAGPHRLGTPARSVDAQPRHGPTRPGRGARTGGGHHGGGRRRRVTRRPLPAPRSGRRDAARSTGTSFPRWPRRRPSAPGSSICSARIEHVVRLGHVEHVTAARDRPRRRVGPPARRARSSCTARRPGCSTRRWFPSGRPDAIRLQTIRVGFPCFNAALAGYVEATRDDDRERNRLCPPNTLPDNPRELGPDAGSGNRRRAHASVPSRTSPPGPTAAR